METGKENFRRKAEDALGMTQEERDRPYAEAKAKEEARRAEAKAARLKAERKHRRRVWMVASVVFVAVFTLVLVVFANPMKKTPADKIAVSYGGGAFEGAQYQKTVEPGSGLLFNGWFDRWYEYPTTQRNYIISAVAVESDRSSSDDIKAFSADKVETSVELTVAFKLNTNEIREFHEKIGLKFEAWTKEGWDKMLNDNFRQPLENSVQRVLREFDVDKIASDPKVLSDVQEAVEETLKVEVNRLLGGEYFCGPGFVIGKDDCPNFKIVVKRISLPDSIVDAFKKQETSAAEIISAENSALAKEKEAEGERARQSVLTGSLTEQYLAFLEVQAQQKCAENPSCVLVIGQANTNVNIPVQPPK